MENINIQPTKKSPKVKIILILVFILLGLGAYGYFWFSNIIQENNQAKTAIIKAEKYDALKRNISTEYARCQSFITQGQGNFGSFEYCKKFTDWVIANNILDI